MRHRRRIFLFALAVAVPALILAGLSWRAFRQEQAERREEVRRRAEVAARGALRDIEGQLRALRERWWREAGDSVDALVAFARERGAAMAVRGPDGRMLYPRSLEEGPSLEDLFAREDPDGAVVLAQAVDLEFAQHRWAEAAQVYGRLAGRAEAAGLRAALLHAQGRALRRAGSEARPIYERLAREFGELTSESGLPYTVIAASALSETGGLARELARAAMPGKIRSVLLPLDADAQALERVEAILSREDAPGNRIDDGRLVSVQAVGGATVGAAIAVGDLDVPSAEAGLVLRLNDAPSPGEALARQVSEEFAGLAVTAFCIDPALLRPSPERLALAAGMVACLVGALLLGLGAMVRAVGQEMRLAQLKGDFVSGVSHELKTPLTSIRMFAEMLEADQVPDAEKRRQYYRIIHREALRLSGLVENVLDFARLEEGRKTFEFKEQPLNEIVAASAETFRILLSTGDFRVRIPDERLTARVDAEGIRRAVLNLLENAAKYGGERPEIELTLERVGEAAEISVRDRGPGIAPDERERIFEKFYRGRVMAAGPSGGVGMGLSLVKQTLEAHGGTVAVESEVGKGSRFILRIPLCPRSS